MFSPCFRTKYFKSLIIIGAFLAWPGRAGAFEYEFEVPIQDEEDINDAYTLGLIEDEETVNNLINMLRDGLDVNRARYNDFLQLPGITARMADAILNKRKELGRFSSMADLQQIEEVPGEIWEEIIPFLKLPDGQKKLDKVPVTGSARLGYIQYKGSGREEPLNEKDHLPGLYLKGESTVQIKDYKISIGTLMTVRELNKNFFFNKDNNYLMVKNPNAMAYSFDGMYGMVEGPWFKTILGSYNIGFGEKLTFDSTGKARPNGIATPLHYYENNNSGTVRPEKSLLGIAATFDNLRLPKGWMTASVFLSYKKEDIYQYDFWYGADDEGELIACNTNSDCNSGDPLKTYTCGSDGFCHSSRIYSRYETKEGTLTFSHQYATMYRFYQERLFGGQVAYNLNDRTHFGVLGYASQWLFSDEIPGAMFSLTSSYPGRASIYAFGAYGAIGIGVVDMGFEASIQDNKGVGAVYRLEASPLKELDITWKMRFYNALYDNPYCRGQAAADEILGKRNRNEFGNRYVVTYRPIKYLRLTTDFDIWSHPFTEVKLDNGKIYQMANEPWITDIALTQRFVIHPAPRNTITLWASYKNKDISVNGYSYLNDNGEEKGNAYAARANLSGLYVEGRGEQVQAAIQGQTNAYKPLNITLALINNFEGVTKYTDRFDYTLKLWLLLSYKPWKYTNISTKLKYWYHNNPEYDIGTYYSDRGEPTVDWYIFVTQQFPMGFSLKVHYGLTKYIDNRKDNDTGRFLRYDMYHVIKAYIEWNYESMLANKTFASMKESGSKKSKKK